MSRAVFGLLIVAVLAVVGCRTTTRDSHSPPQSPSSPIEPTILQYTDTDGFDLLFEASLINRDPVILVQTENEKPEWDGRLNAWIAAWNMGGKGDRRVIRGQIPLSAPSIDAEFLREFRLLVFGAVEHAEDLARAGSAWWREERIRSRRVALLRQYNLRFHMNEEKKIHLIFFHGDHAGQYPDFMATLTGAEERNWSRNVECSMCRKLRAEASVKLADKVSE